MVLHICILLISLLIPITTIILRISLIIQRQSNSRATHHSKSKTKLYNIKSQNTAVLFIKYSHINKYFYKKYCAIEIFFVILRRKLF